MVEVPTQLDGSYRSEIIQFYGEYQKGVMQPYPFYVYQVIGLMAPWAGSDGRVALIRCLTDNSEATKKLHIGSDQSDPIQMAITHLKDRHRTLRSC